jgi:hypothetical protein
MMVMGSVLDADALAWVRDELEPLTWRSGEKTAGWTARRVKRNERAVLSTPRGKALEAFVRGSAIRCWRSLHGHARSVRSSSAGPLKRAAMATTSIMVTCKVSTAPCGPTLASRSF